ncbi:MAG: hypothetical protein HY326_13575 [Chloroflexi bacterium]|nr:hypothetical protein [Chloroflexota bacterium]
MYQTRGDLSGQAQAAYRIEREIGEKQARLKEIIGEREALRLSVAHYQENIKSIDRQIGSLGKASYQKSSVVYLNGQSFDRGTLELFDEVLRFSGWRGNVVVRLPHIAGIQIGFSKLGRFAGVPVLEKLWPGPRRLTDTLLITVSDPIVPNGNSPNRAELMVLTGLDDAVRWRDLLRDRQFLLKDLVALRADFQAQRLKFETEIFLAQEDLHQIEAHTYQLQGELAVLKLKLRMGGAATFASQQLQSGPSTEANRKN